MLNYAEVKSTEINQNAPSEEVEIWKTHYSGYEVSSFGRIKQLKYPDSTRKYTDNGVSLLVHSKIGNFIVSKLVLEIFNDIKYSDISSVKYKDGNYRNLKLSNLQPVYRRIKPITHKKEIDILEGEIWKFSKKYKTEISNFGRIKSRSLSEGLRKFQVISGYNTCYIRRRQYMVHRLVVETFIGKIGKNKVVNHKDYNRLNNHISNLEIISASENSFHGCKNKKNDITLRIKIQNFENVKEEWIQNSAGYWVSNIGNVKKYSGKQLIPKNGNGYLYYSLKGKMTRIHRLVYEAYIGRIPDGFVVNHKDGNKINNFVGNLEALTPKENSKHAKEAGLMNYQVGEKANNSKFKDIEILTLYKRAIIDRDHLNILCNHYNCSYTTMSRILSGETYSHVYNSEAGSDIQKYKVFNGYCILK